MTLAPLNPRVLQNLGLSRGFDAFRDDLQRGGGKEGSEAVEPQLENERYARISRSSSKSGPSVKGM